MYANAAPSDDRRREHRRLVQQPVEYRVPGQPGGGTAVITEISEYGMCLQAQSEFAEGAVLVLKVLLDKTPAKVAWLVVRVAHARRLERTCEYAAGCVYE